MNGSFVYLVKLGTLACTFQNCFIPLVLSANPSHLLAMAKDRRIRDQGILNSASLRIQSFFFFKSSPKST